MPVSLLQHCSHFTAQERARVERAIEVMRRFHEGQMRADGSPYANHPLAVAEILCIWKADVDSVIAGLLHDTVEDTELTSEEISRQFGPNVAALVEGVTKFSVADFAEKESLESEVETLRRLFEVMRKDIRVLLIKIADRLHNLRTIEGLSPERRVTFAQESLDVYYKLAYHLGMNEICREIMNICIPYVYPEKAQIRDRHWREQKESVTKAIANIEIALKNSDVHDDVFEVRFVKSSHDLPRPHQEDEAPDRAYYCVIIVRDVDSCYEIFKVLHRLYHPVRRRFHDYIASPPESGYRSLHTTVIGPHDKPIQIRIRTTEMDAQVKWGVLLNAFGGGEASRQFTWLQRSADLDRTTRESSEAFWRGLQSDIFQKSMHITIHGEMISIPQGSTALDAAFLQRGAEANKIVKLVVNGQEKEMSTQLNEDDVIEVFLGGASRVSTDWLQFVKTKYARNQIVEALKEFDRTDRFMVGQRLLQKELDHFQKTLVGEITRPQQDAIAQYFHRLSFEDVIVMIGEGVIHPQEIIIVMQQGGKSVGKKRTFRFSLDLQVGEQHRDEVIGQVSALVRLHEIVIQNMTMKPVMHRGFIILQLRGYTSDKVKYADFISSLERHSWITKMLTRLSFEQKFFLLLSFSAALVVLFIDAALLRYAQAQFTNFTSEQTLLLEIALAVPPLIANFYLLKILRHYVVLLRNDRWFFGLAFLFNLFACSFIIYQSAALGMSYSIWPLIAVLTFFMFYIGYKFLITEQLFVKVRRESQIPLSRNEWLALRWRKIIGYTFRLGAVTIWGIQPLYLKYTPANDVEPIIRVFLTGVGVLLVTGIVILIKWMRYGVDRSMFRLPKNIFLVNIVIGYILFTYFLNASVQSTTGTNFILFNSFSPVFGLFIGAVLWRSSVPYLKEPDMMLRIFIIFLLGSTGSALILYNTTQGTGGSMYGDIMGLLAMVADTVLVVSQIRYMKLFQNVSSLAINVYVFSSHILTIIPVFLWLYLSKNPAEISYTITPLLYGIGAGVLAGIGQMFNYETFRRIDGFIAFLMFNISILITFLIEVFFLGKVIPSWALVVGGIIIIFSTIAVESINTSSEKKGM
jgi:RelA/SpoT family (p)ppGpp synthetase